MLEIFVWRAADLAGIGIIKKIKNVKKAAVTTSKIVSKVRIAKRISINQMQQQVVRGKAPKTITRVEKAIRERMEKAHVHFKDGSALNRDGTWKHGGKKLTNKECKWLKEAGWRLPK